MTGYFSGKVVLITGGGTGIGAAAARHYAKLGAHVVVTGRRLEPIAQVAADIEGVAVAGDTGDEAHCLEAVATAVERFGGLDIIVANAAVEMFGSVTDIAVADWNAAVDTNLNGVFLICRAGLPELRKRVGGSIIVVSSALGLNTSANFSAYVTTKHAIIGLTRSMAMDYGPEGIRVNALCPGWVRTELAVRTIQAVADQRGVSLEEMMHRLCAHYPLRRMAEPEEMATCIEFLSSPMSGNVTGSVLVADSGGLVVNSGTLEF